VALDGDWPAGFLASNGTARMYFDTEVSQEQRSVLESIFSGQKGGIFEVLAALKSNVLPAREVPINIQPGEDATRIKVGDVGRLMVEPLHDE
jgi:hypothetical protein